GQPFSDLRDVPVFLQPLTRDIERQIRRIDDAAYETKISGEQLLAMFHDQHPPHEQVQTEFAGGVEQIERGLRWDEQQCLILRPSFGTERPGGERLIPVM